jgi:two-component system, cell cycle sensor histidine kinase and response regulator CckA
MDKNPGEQQIQSQTMLQPDWMAQGLAHDFKNLLVIIGGYSEQLLQNLQDPNLRQMAEAIQGATDRATALAEQIGHLGQRMTSALVRIDINALLASWDCFIQGMLGSRISVTLNLDPQLQPIWADKNQIEQVVLNLTINAGDAILEDGELIIATRNVNLPDGGSGVVMTVSDNGCGMEPTVREQIFKPFYTQKRNGKGTGLGLYVVSTIVKNLGGTIEVESAPNRGTTFTIFLPRQEQGTQPNQGTESSMVALG